ncbi:MAG TPA: hypothetical protein VF365_09985 [Candidatus Limnocylindria bacterium]
MFTKRRTIPHSLRGAILLAVLLAVIGPMPARAASAVEIEARALLGGRYEPGGWAAIAVTLVNGGTPTEGWLQSDTDAGAVRRFVEMPAGSRKSVTLYVQPSGFQRQIEVRYEEPNGTARTAVEVQVFQQVADHIAIVGDGSGSLRAQLAGALYAGAPEPIALGTADLPDRPEALAGLATVVWAADSTTLGETQRRALERWVAEGGRLIVVGGADWQARTAAFVEILPIERLGAVDGVSQAALAAWSGSDEAPVAESTVATGPLRDDARGLVAADDGSHLLSMRPVGAGRVILVGPDAANQAFRGWDGAPTLWARMLPTNAMFEAAFGGGVPNRDQVAGSMEQALNTLPSLEVPPAELLLAVIVGYILLIGPVSYVVLRRLDRRELAWVTAPILVLAFSAASYGIGLSLKGTQSIVNQIAIVRSTTAGTAATVETYAGVFSPTRATFDLVVETDALVGRLRGPAVREGATAATSGLAAEQGDPARLRQLAVTAGGYEHVRADGVVEHEPMMTVSWSFEDGAIVGTVTNIGEVALDDVAFISMAGGEMIGTLEPGGSEQFRVEGAGVNRSSAADQVYGFGGIDTSNPERRRIVARRGVIEALVGYGGWMPSGSELGGVGGRGPFIIGWHAGEGPMPIQVEGLQTQRYAEIAEVVGVQPELGRGEVVVGPGQMGVTVTTEGDATITGPATVSLISGSATFGISLPVTASGIAVTGVELVIGPDAGSALQDPGSFGGFWPPGYLVELRDPASGEWSVLGDLAEGNVFRIDDPASAISSTGLIEVRISVEQGDPNFGQPGVFASATVTGVIGE